jgi:hypothetical protein
MLPGAVARLRAGRAARCTSWAAAQGRRPVRVGINPIVTLEKQQLNIIGNLV